MSRRDLKLTCGSLAAHDFLWDGANRLRDVKKAGSGVFTAKYDGDGLRVEKTETRDGSTFGHVYSWSPFGVLHDSQQYRLYTPGFAQRVNGVDRFSHTDCIGSTRYLTDSTGNSMPSALNYDAFGRWMWMCGPDHPSDFLFAGGWDIKASSTRRVIRGWGCGTLNRDNTTRRLVASCRLIRSPLRGG